MPTINILFGFDEPEFEHAVETSLREQGYTVESTVKLSKGSIRDFLMANPKFDTAILLEVVSKTNKFTADELAIMTDERDINLIPVLNANLKGSEYMQTLYSAGITSAIFSSKKGATVQDVTELIIHKRTRREAREYYGISDKPIELGFLGNDTFTEYYGHLSSEQYGNSLIERFINVCTHMSQKQIADFIRRLPAEMLDELKLYEEFHMIVALLKEVGIDLHIKRPRKVQIGLATPDQIDTLSNRFGTIKSGTEATTATEKETSPLIDEYGEGCVVENIQSNSAYKGMTFAELMKKADSSSSCTGDEETAQETEIHSGDMEESAEVTDHGECASNDATESEENIQDFTLATADKKSRHSRSIKGKKKKEKKEKKEKKLDAGNEAEKSVIEEKNPKKIVLILSIVLAFAFIFLGLYFSGVFDVIRIALLNN